MNPLVSIIVPNYNHQNFLKQRLESIFNQTFQDFEVILLDDASVDNSLTILGPYKNHPKVTHFIINKENSGSSFKQWQKGVKLAKGEYIWIAESDDYCEPTFLEELLFLFNDQTVIAYSASKLVNENSKFLSLDPYVSGLVNKRWLQNFRNSGKDEIINYLRYVNTIPNASAVLFRKERIENIKIPIHMKFAGDWYIWLEMLKNGELMYLNKPLNSFRMHNNSTRVVREFKKEKMRYQEYFKILCENSSLWNRIGNREKYRWVLLELWSKREIFSKKIIFQSGIPFEFKLMFKLMELTNFYYTFKRRLKI